jgi:hypothetical protein
MTNRPFQYNITGRTEKELNKRIEEAMERNPKLTIKVAPKIIEDGRIMRGSKWIAVLIEREDTCYS